MTANILLLNNKNNMPDWLTIKEAVRIVNKTEGIKITKSDIYRNALCGKINLSIYFQSSVLLGKIRVSGYKPKLHLVSDTPFRRFCLLEKNCFLNDRNLIISTERKYFNPRQKIIDTTLLGYEYVLIQRLLANTLNLPLPVAGTETINYGLTVTISEGVFQLFEKTTWQDRMKKQMAKLPESRVLDVASELSTSKIHPLCRNDYFPLHELPADACFVIRHSELERLINSYTKNIAMTSPSTRISTPLSRMLWLACKHNETTSPLIRQPYKLLSIFEQWASDDGITDHLSGDTLKNALKRGSPSSTSLHD